MVLGCAAFCLSDLWPGDKYFWDFPRWIGGNFCVCATVAGGFGGAGADGHPAGFLVLAGVWVAAKFPPSHRVWPYPGARLAYVFTVLLAVNVALAAFVLIRRVDGIGYWIGSGRHGDFLRWGVFRVRVHRDSAGNGDALHCVCAAMSCVAFAGVHLAGDFLFYGLAGGAIVSRVVAKHSFAGVEERFGGVVDGVGAVRVFAHYELGISELAVRHPRVHAGIFYG